MAGEQGITPEEKIRRALELLLTRGREKFVKRDVKELGILLLIMRIYNSETNVFRLEEDIEKLLEEKNIVELVKKKFNRFKEEEGLLVNFVGSENAAVTEIIRKINLQNELLSRLKRRLEEREKARKPQEIVLAIKKPEKNAEVYIGEHVELEAEFIGQIPPNATFQWYIEQGKIRKNRINIHSGISGMSGLPIGEQFQVNKKAKIIVQLEQLVAGVPKVGEVRKVFASDKREVIVKKRIRGPTELGAPPRPELPRGPRIFEPLEEPERKPEIQPKLEDVSVEIIKPEKDKEHTFYIGERIGPLKAEAKGKSSYVDRINSKDQYEFRFIWYIYQKHILFPGIIHLGRETDTSQNSVSEELQDGEALLVAEIRGLRGQTPEDHVKVTLKRRRAETSVEDEIHQALDDFLKE